MSTNVEQFIVTLLERLFSVLWNELQGWLTQPGNFDKALTYIDEILTNAGLTVNPDPNAQPSQAAPVPNGTPATAKPAAESLVSTVASWFPGAKG